MNYFNTQTPFPRQIFNLIEDHFTPAENSSHSSVDRMWHSANREKSFWQKQLVTKYHYSKDIAEKIDNPALIAHRLFLLGKYNPELYALVQLFVIEDVLGKQEQFNYEPLYFTSDQLYYFSPCFSRETISKSYLFEACDTCNTDLITANFKEYSINDLLSALIYCLKKANLKMVKFFYAENKAIFHCGEQYSILTAAINSNDITILNYLFSLNEPSLNLGTLPQKEKKYLLMYVIETDNAQIFQLMKLPLTEDLLPFILEKGAVNIFKLLFNNYKDAFKKLHERGFDFASSENMLLVKELESKFKSKMTLNSEEFPGLIYRAIRSGNPEMVEYLIERGLTIEKLTLPEFKEALYSNHLKMAKWLTSEKGGNLQLDPKDPDILESALLSKNIEVCNWLVTPKPEGAGIEPTINNLSIHTFNADVTENSAAMRTLYYLTDPQGKFKTKFPASDFYNETSDKFYKKTSLGLRFYHDLRKKRKLEYQQLEQKESKEEKQENNFAP